MTGGGVERRTTDGRRRIQAQAQTESRLRRPGDGGGAPVRGHNMTIGVPKLHGILRSTPAFAYNAGLLLYAVGPVRITTPFLCPQLR